MGHALTHTLPFPVTESLYKLQIHEKGECNKERDEEPRQGRSKRLTDVGKGF